MLEDCVKYFKENTGHKRIMVELKNKWLSYGKVTGIVTISNPDKNEIDAINSFLGRRMEDNKIRFKVSEFEKSLKESKFSEVDFLELLERYFGESLIPKKEKNEISHRNKVQFFQNIKIKLENTGKYDETILRLFEKIISEKHHFYKNKDETSNKETENMILFSLQAINFLKNLKKIDKKIKLAILSAKITSNPHYFDRGTTEGNFFLYLLFSMNNEEYYKESEKIFEVYYKSGIEIDSISSFTTAFGIHLYTDSGVHQAYEEFIKNSEDYVITLSNLKKIKKADCKNKKVFVVENQMVFSYLCEYFRGKEVAMMCTSGQLKTASLILIDILCKNDCIIYYSGDLDPEGIEIADKLIERGQGKIIPWHFSVKDYEKSVSNKIISNESLKKLEKIKNKNFEDLIKKIYVKKRAGYQELFLEELKEDIIYFGG